MTRYCIFKVPYGSAQKRGEVTCRAKIDHLNYRKHPIKHIWGESPLSHESTELTIESKIASFDGVTCRYTKGTGHQYVRKGVCVLANFSKTAEQKKTPFVQFVARLETRIILKNEPNRCILQGVIAKIMYRIK